MGCPDGTVAVGRWPVITSLGVTQILAWGSSYYLPAVLVEPISAGTGWSPSWVVGGLSLGLLTAAAASPLVGRVIARRGGRPVLVASALLLAAGQCGLGLAPTLPDFVAAWVVVGLGMAAGLYDPAFATLGRLYGAGGRSAITTLTLFGGFASTISWPLSAFLAAALGWRGACLSYAAIQVAVSLPIYMLGVPREPPLARALTAPVLPEGPSVVGHGSAGTRLLLLTSTVTLASIVSTFFSVHLLVVLQDKGLSLSAAVALGALVGPSQVGARALELAVGNQHHPIWTKLAATTLVTIGVTALWTGGPWLTPALVLYGAGIGLESIARGTLPLSMVGPDRYPVVMGRIAGPSLVAQAVAPLAGSFLLRTIGTDQAVLVLAGAAGLNLLLAWALFSVLRPSMAGTALPHGQR